AGARPPGRAGEGPPPAPLRAGSLSRAARRPLPAGASPAGIIRGLRAASDDTRTYLASKAKKVDGNADIKAIATIASNNDASIGRLLAEAFQKVGEDGVISVDEGKGLDTEVKVVEGMQFDRGFLSPHFATNMDTLEAVLESPYILIHEEKISSAQKLLPLLEAAKDAGAPLLIIAEDIEGEALATLVLNKMRGIVNVCAVKAPGYGDRRKEMLRDLATLTAAVPFMKDSGQDLEKAKLTDLGRAQKIVVNNSDTTLVKGAGRKEDVQSRANMIRRQMEETTSDYDREKLEERLAKLVGGIAQIQVGGATETEVKEKKARFEDAKNATRAALEEGVLPGGGVALLRAGEVLRSDGDGDEALGRRILAKALAQPLRVIAENAGKDGSVVAHAVLREKKFSFGYNALTDTYGDLLEMGVIDPVKVTRTALENAVSVACTLISTDCLVTESSNEDTDADQGDYDADF
ncbi:MAG: molecular chaperone GroEL, partial [Planctomycetes bacterium]|nr:molecular chaperone GroEL [Planctomycetota bacterium]